MVVKVADLKPGGRFNGYYFKFDCDRFAYTGEKRKVSNGSSGVMVKKYVFRNPNRSIFTDSNPDDGSEKNLTVADLTNDKYNGYYFLFNCERITYTGETVDVGNGSPGVTVKKYVFVDPNNSKLFLTERQVKLIEKYEKRESFGPRLLTESEVNSLRPEPGPHYLLSTRPSIRSSSGSSYDSPGSSRPSGSQELPKTTGTVRTKGTMRTTGVGSMGMGNKMMRSQRTHKKRRQQKRQRTHIRKRKSMSKKNQTRH
jgi:hypothetical protein